MNSWVSSSTEQEQSPKLFPGKADSCLSHHNKIASQLLFIYRKHLVSPCSQPACNNWTCAFIYEEAHLCFLHCYATRGEYRLNTLKMRHYVVRQQL
jgi:hypothetical protein